MSPPGPAPRLSAISGVDTTQQTIAAQHRLSALYAEGIKALAAQLQQLVALGVAQLYCCAEVFSYAAHKVVGALVVAGDAVEGRIRRAMFCGSTTPMPFVQNASMTAALSTTPSIPIDPRISAIASGIAAAIPEAQVRLFGSRAKGTSRPDSDVDLLITVPDQWLAVHDRVRVLGDLWRQYSSHRLPLDLLLYAETEVFQRQQCRSAVISLACQEGILLYG